MANIQLVYALSHQQTVVDLNVAEKTTVADAIEKSKLLEKFPELVKENISVGIFSKKVALTDYVKEGDRIELYRPLLIDPKQARRLRS
jgi:uncharacterized protein